MLNLLLRASRNVPQPRIQTYASFSVRDVLHETKDETRINVHHQRMQTYASFSVRDVLHETNDETGTLTTRFAKHIALEATKCTPLVPTKIRYVDYFPVTDVYYFQKELKHLEPEQLPALIIFASTYRSNADATKFAFILNELDDVAVRLLPEMCEDTVLRTMYSLLFLMPNWMTRTDFYHKAVKRLTEEFGTRAKEKFVQLCFYLGLEKKHASAKRSEQQLLKKLLDGYLEFYLPQLSTLDLAVVSNAAYKTATPIECNAYNQRLVQEVTQKMSVEGGHDALLVNFVKAMRFQRVYSTEICEFLSKICGNSETLKQLQTRGFVHLFAYLAENLWDSEDCTRPLIQEFFRRLKENKKLSQPAEVLRGKDIDTFLWCCAQLNCKLCANDLECLEWILLEKVRNDEFNYFPDQLVDCCLWLWFLGQRSKELLQHAVNIKTQARPNVKRQPKVDSRLTVLLSAAAIEEPDFVKSLKGVILKPPFNLNAAAPSYLLKDRDDMTTYIKRLQSEETGIPKPKLICPINGINILSILINYQAPKTTVLVEILTERQVLRFSGQPVSILRLKMHLLQVLGCKVVLLRPSDLTNNHTSLREIVFGIKNTRSDISGSLEANEDADESTDARTARSV